MSLKKKKGHHTRNNNTITKSYEFPNQLESTDFSLYESKILPRPGSLLKQRVDTATEESIISYNQRKPPPTYLSKMNKRSRKNFKRWS